MIFRLKATLQRNKFGGIYRVCSISWLKPYGKSRHFGRRLLPYVTTKERREWESHNKQLDERIASLKTKLDRKARELAKKHVEQRIAKLPQVLHADLRKMLATPNQKRGTIGKYLAEKFEKTLRIDQAELRKLDCEFQMIAEATERQLKSLEGERKLEPKIRALWDRGAPSPTYVLRRGNYLTPGELLEPGVPAVFGTPYVVRPPWPGALQTGRRLAFARWLTRPDHPLTARVMVNRIWKHHFATGIVQSLDNFGKTGTPPTHPELLDWLAVEFVRGDWSIKAIDRLMMTSSTYRQASSLTPEHQRLDPQNRLLCRMPLRRLDAESLRDTLLSISGRLDDRPFGPADDVNSRSDGLVTSVGSNKGWRRSIYVVQRRTRKLTILEAFDQPQMNPNCTERHESTVALQALYLMNNRMVRELADAFAERVVAEVGTDPNRQIQRAFLIGLSRKPTAQEMSLSSSTLAGLTREWEQTLAGKLDSDKSAGKKSGFFEKTGFLEARFLAPGKAQEKRSRATSKLRQQAALRALGNFCHGLMNSAALLYID